MIFSRFLTHANFIYIYLDVTTQTTPIFHDNLSKMYLLQVLFIDACHHQWFWSQLSWHKLTGVSNKVFVFTRFKEIPERYVASTDRSAALELLKTKTRRRRLFRKTLTWNSFRESCHWLHFFTIQFNMHDPLSAQKLVLSFYKIYCNQPLTGDLQISSITLILI